MKQIWIFTVVLVACAAAPAVAQPGPATKDRAAPSETPNAPPAAATTPAAAVKKKGGGGESGDGGALMQASLFGAKTAVPWRGSQFVYRNTVSAVSLNPDAELTYNPYYAMTYSFRPWWWFTRSFYVRATLDVDHEITNSDITTNQGEALLRDLRLVTGLSSVLRIPKAKIDFSFDLVLTLPTSKASWARTFVLGVGPGVRASRTFKVLGGMVVGYNFRSTAAFHRYTTGELDGPLIPGCGGSVGGCDRFYNTGRRNAMVRLSHYADFSVRFLKWLGLSLAVGQTVDFLYPLGDTPEEVSLQTVEPENERYLTFFELQVAFQPLKMLEIAVGYSAVHPQRRPDSTHYVPFFNRYSALYLDLKLKIDGLVARIKRSAK